VYFNFSKVLRVNLQRQILFWLGAFVVFIFLLWMLSDILLPFVAGMALAYFLDPVADKLERFGLSRLTATIVILLGFVLLVVLSMLVIVPILVEQFTGFVNNIPNYVASVQRIIAEPGQQWLRELLGNRLNSIQSSLGPLVSQGASWLGGFLTSVWSGGKTLISLMSLLVVTPVVAFYMLVDWDKMIATIDGWLPRRNRDTLRHLAREIDRSVAGFIRGQALVCIILGFMYAVGLTIIGLNFGLLIGLVAGIISFIPFVGSLIGLVISVGIALVQFWPDWVVIAAVVGVFAIGQFIEGNILSPKLVGRSVGLHPVWLMFALLAFGYLMGFFGMLVAIPLAAALGVLMRFALAKYLQSPFYTGIHKEPVE
jgi:predicted PurR-regulated permease PerM